MTIDHTRPEDTVHAARASELLAVVALIATATHGRSGAGSIACPVCAGTLAYTVRALEPADTRVRCSIGARCSTSGCLTFQHFIKGVLPMAIDFSDPAQTTHNDKPIPINTQEKYDKGEQILRVLYVVVGVPWTDASEQNYETRVRNGQTMAEILANTYSEYLERSTNVPGA